MAFIEADTGKFHHRVRFAGDLLVHSFGSYQLSTTKAALTTVINPPDGEPMTFRYRIIGPVVYMNVPLWPRDIRDCWLALDEKTTARLTKKPLARITGRFPAHFGAVRLAEGVDYLMGSTTTVSGTTALARLTAMFGPGFHDLARSMEGDQGTAFVEFRLRDGLISDIEASGRSLLRALDKRGVEVPDDMRSGLHLLNVTVNYTDLGEPVTLKAPRGHGR